MIEIIPASQGTPSYEFSFSLRDQLTNHLEGFEQLHEPVDETLREAAVALTVVDAGGGLASLVLTRRALGLRAHAGQWALPGGRIDPGETVTEAARRELSEEVGLEVNETEVLGQLDVYPTRSGYAITPVVVWGGEVESLHPNPGEVHSIHLLPLGELDRVDSIEMEYITQSPKPVIRLNVGDTWLHAPTAALIHQFHKVAIHGEAVRVNDLEQPFFAWR